MKDELFKEIVESVKEGGAILRGEKKPSRGAGLDTPDVAAVRQEYDLSQARFAALLGISVRTLQNWEQGRREPQGPAAGWTTGDAKDFLHLSDAEAEFIEMKLALAESLRARRLERHLNQTQVARIIGSSQSRVAKMEAADPSVSIDLLIKALLKLGAGREDVAETFTHRVAASAS